MVTPDELVLLLEDLFEDLTVKALRQGVDYKPAVELSDESWSVMVRFIGGERPESLHKGIPDPMYKTAGEVLLEFEGAPRTAMRKERTDPDVPVKLKGQFDGVELP